MLPITLNDLNNLEMYLSPVLYTFNVAVSYIKSFEVLSSSLSS